jgi:hypothetical protein
MKKLLFLLIFPFIAFSQNVTGIVLDAKTNKPIERVHIQVDNDIFLTDKKGHFSFSFLKPTSITITHINYKTQIIRINNTNDLEVFLNEKREILPQVEITTKRINDKIKFTFLEDIPGSFHSFGAVLKDHKIFIFGGDATTYEKDYQKTKSKLFVNEFRLMQDMEILFSTPIYNPFFIFKNDILTYSLKDKIWTTIKEEIRPRANLNAALVDDKIYVLGGKRKSRDKQYLDDKIEILDVKKEAIIVDNTNPHQAVNFATSVYKNKIILSGGSKKISKNGFINYSDEIHVFDTKSGFWYLLGKMKKGKETKSIIVNEKLYLVGGLRNKKIKTIESFHLKTGKWASEGDLFSPLERPALAEKKNTIYIFENRKLLTLDITSNVLKLYHIDLPYIASEMFLKDNFLYILGGYKEDRFSVTSSRKLVKISLDEFSKTKVIKNKTL